MAPRISILIYGRDARLLDSRGWLLEASGYRVQAAHEMAEVQRALEAGKFDLLILCHSLSIEERGWSIATCQAAGPGMRCLFLTTHGTVIDQVQQDVLSTADGPAKFLKGVEEVVARQCSSHAHIY